jgi:hypothetical protein
MSSLRLAHDTLMLLCSISRAKSSTSATETPPLFANSTWPAM